MKVCPVCSHEYPDDVRFCPLDGQTLRAPGGGADLVGQVVADRYHVLKKLGEGGMGQVYLAEHVKMGRKSAIKIMTPAMANDPDAVSRFNREASNASRISHPNVCQIYDFGETSDGLIYLAMEFIEGVSLREIVEREGALDLARGASILQQTADALAAAHDLGIVHRDLKPDNIMITATRDGSELVKVVDFGIAKAVGGDGGAQKVTKTGLVVGTPEYMSPEQLAGDPLDARSDIYSLALVFYRVITGTLPFAADSAQETMIKRLTDDPMTLAAVRPDLRFPPALQAVLDRALARSPAERYARATDFARDALASLGGAVPATRIAPPVLAQAATQLLDSGAARRAATAPRRGAPAKRSPLLPIAAGVGGVAVLAAVAMIAMGRGQGPAVTDIPRDSLLGQPLSGTTFAGRPGTSATPATGTGAERPGPSLPVAAAPAPAVRPPEPVPGPTPARPEAASAVAIADSLRVADDLYDASQFAAARRTAMFVWTFPAASGGQKARAARLVATTYLEENDQNAAITWYQNSLRYDRGNEQVLTMLRRLGVTP